MMSVSVHLHLHPCGVGSTNSAPISVKDSPRQVVAFCPSYDSGLLKGPPHYCDDKVRLYGRPIIIVIREQPYKS